MHFSLLHFPPSIWCFQSWRKTLAYTVMQWLVFWKNAGSFWHTLRAELQSVRRLELGQDCHMLATHRVWLHDLAVRSEAVVLPGLCSGAPFRLIRSLVALRFPRREEARVACLEATCRCSLEPQLRCQLTASITHQTQMKKPLGGSSPRLWHHPSLWNFPLWGPRSCDAEAPVFILNPAPQARKAS